MKRAEWNKLSAGQAATIAAQQCSFTDFVGSVVRALDLWLSAQPQNDYPTHRRCMRSVRAWARSLPSSKNYPIPSPNEYGSLPSTPGTSGRVIRELLHLAGNGNLRSVDSLCEVLSPFSASEPLSRHVRERLEKWVTLEEDPPIAALVPITEPAAKTITTGNPADSRGWSKFGRCVNIAIEAVCNEHKIPVADVDLYADSDLSVSTYARTWIRLRGQKVLEIVSSLESEHLFKLVTPGSSIALSLDTSIYDDQALTSLIAQHLHKPLLGAHKGLPDVQPESESVEVGPVQESPKTESEEAPPAGGSGVNEYLRGEVLRAAIWAKDEVNKDPAFPKVYARLNDKEGLTVYEWRTLNGESHNAPFKPAAHFLHGQLPDTWVMVVGGNIVCTLRESDGMGKLTTLLREHMTSALLREQKEEVEGTHDAQQKLGRDSTFTIKQQFAEGFDPDKISLLFAKEMEKAIPKFGDRLIAMVDVKLAKTIAKNIEMSLDGPAPEKPVSSSVPANVRRWVEHACMQVCKALGIAPADLYRVDGQDCDTAVYMTSDTGPIAILRVEVAHKTSGTEVWLVHDATVIADEHGLVVPAVHLGNVRVEMDLYDKLKSIVSSVQCAKIAQTLKEKPTMITDKDKQEPSTLATLEVDAVEAAWRTAGVQFVKLSRSNVVATLCRHIAPGDESVRARIALFLESEVGTLMLQAFLALGLGALPKTPVLADVLPRLARELRVQSMADVGDLLAELLMAPLRQVMADYIRDLPPPAQGTLPGLPVATPQPDPVGAVGNLLRIPKTEGSGR